MADTDDSYQADRARSKQLNDRATAMNLSRDEAGVLISYLTGGAPDALERALDYIERRRETGAAGSYSEPGS